MTVDTVDHWAETNNLSGLFVIKVDAEGEDEHVLAGAASTIATHAPVLIVEYWSNNRSAYALFSTHTDTTSIAISRANDGSSPRPPDDDNDGNLIACTPRRRADIEQRLARAAVKTG